MLIPLDSTDGCQAYGILAWFAGVNPQEAMVTPPPPALRPSVGYRLGFSPC